MLTAGNHKLGGQLIWSFSLPSASPDICTGLSTLCRQHCYAHRLETIRPSMRRFYQANLRLSRSPGFVRKLCTFLVEHRVAVVRLHVGGDFPSGSYARDWLRVMRLLPEVRFFFYTRSWRDESIRPVLERMAELDNCRVWYSCDRETGVPVVVPPRVRLAWLATCPEDLPPAGTHLVFRTVGLRGQPVSHMGGVRVCPAEDGLPRQEPVTCDRCGICWHPLHTPEQDQPILPASVSRRMNLPVLSPSRAADTQEPVPPRPGDDQPTAGVG
jgi:hypothetical protein